MQALPAREGRRVGKNGSMGRTQLRVTALRVQQHVPGTLEARYHRAEVGRGTEAYNDQYGMFTPTSKPQPQNPNLETQNPKPQPQSPNLKAPTSKNQKPPVRLMACDSGRTASHEKPIKFLMLFAGDILRL